jgi:hypothetical protein
MASACDILTKPGRPIEASALRGMSAAEALVAKRPKTSIVHRLFIAVFLQKGQNPYNPIVNFNQIYPNNPDARLAPSYLKTPSGQSAFGLIFVKHVPVRNTINLENLLKNHRPPFIERCPQDFTSLPRHKDARTPRKS